MSGTFALGFLVGLVLATMVWCVVVVAKICRRREREAVAWTLTAYPVHEDGARLRMRTFVCPVPCDPDCDASCHEIHQPHHKREHEPADCPARRACGDDAPRS